MDDQKANFKSANLQEILYKMLLINEYFRKTLQRICSGKTQKQEV